MTKIPNLLEKDISILIVEDETILAMGMKCTLEQFEYEVNDIETTGSNAINSVKQNRPDLVIMDINLKGNMSGIEAANYIWKYYKTPIIFLTSYSDKKTIKDAMRSEPYAYLIKPCRDEELIATIETTMNKHNYFFKNRHQLESQKPITKILYFEDDLSFNKAKGVLYKKDLALKLTGNECKLLEVLSDFPGEPVSFDRISDYIWRDESTNDISKLRTLIYRLKVKIGTNLVESIFELGYKLKLND